MGEYERAHAYFFGYGGNWGSFHEVEDGYIGELLGIPEEEYPDGYIYCGDTPAETFRDFLDAVYVYELVQERDRNLICNDFCQVQINGNHHKLYLVVSEGTRKEPRSISSRPWPL
jgi:hypothetical protein